MASWDDYVKADMKIGYFFRAICGLQLAAFSAAAQESSLATSVDDPTTDFARGVQIAAAPPNLVAPNAVPGGITLVPGTVVVPGVGGTVVTGTVPLAGTVGSTGVGNLDPGLGSIPNVPGTSGALYPPATYPQVGFPGTNQSALPQNLAPGPNAPGTRGEGFDIPLTDGGEPSVAICPAGVTTSNGTC